MWAASAPRPVADSHQSAVPEVTFCPIRIAKAAVKPQHAGMHALLSHLSRPLNLALLLTWAAVAISWPDGEPQMRNLCWGLMVAFLLASLFCGLVPRSSTRDSALLGIMAVSALALVWLEQRSGTTPVLLVVLAAQLSLVRSLRATILAMMVINLVFFLILRQSGHTSPALVVLIYSGFQAFALLVGHYARTAEHARDQLALVNADLLATRALLADSARDAERLRMARELHDVAGHKLTAMRLNLRALSGDPSCGQREEVRLAEQLSGELMSDLRDVVRALRSSHGLDLETALRALAAPLPRLRLDLRIDEDVQVTDPLKAETLLRLVQEALTNAARHANASRLSVDIRRQGNDTAVRLEDDGRVKGAIVEGNGIAGMRERVAALDGSLLLQVVAGRGLRIDVTLPA